MTVRALIAAAGLLLAADFTVAAPPAAGLRSLYIQTWRQIVSVEPLGQNVRVRAIRVAPVHEFCPKPLLVWAAERVVPQTTVEAVAGVRVCAMSQQTVDTAIERAKKPRVSYIDYMGSGLTVVANCDGHEQVLTLRDTPPWVNFDTLKRAAPQVSALWDLSERLSAGMLADNPQTPAMEQEALGTSLLPELRSTKYAAAFGDELARTLEGYTGPPTQRAPQAEVLERDALPLITFAAPVFPPIALSARVFGDVRLRLTVDPETGTVTNVERLADKPLLGDAAVQAVRSWKFDAARAPRQPVDVTLRYQIRCPGD